MMNIAYHHRTLGDGAEGIHIREMVAAFRAIGHAVRVIGPTGEPGIAKRPVESRLARIKSVLPGVVFELAEIGYSAYSFFRALIEIVVHRTDLFYDRYITFNAGIVLAGRITGTPVVLEVNAPLALERLEQPDERLTFRRLANAMEAWICRNATHVIVVSTPLKSYLQSLGVPGEKCLVLPNAADPDRFRPREANVILRRRLAIPDDAYVIGFTGVLRAWHGLDLLIAAVAELRRRTIPAFLLIVGDGRYRDAVEQLIAREGLENATRITGRMNHETVPDYVALFDVAVSPRATFYASPMKVMEYMALGKPVVVPRTQNFLDFVDDEVGETFPDGDSMALAEALARLFHSAARRRKSGDAARRKVEEILNWKANARAVCALVSGAALVAADPVHSGTKDIQ